MSLKLLFAAFAAALSLALLTPALVAPSATAATPKKVAAYWADWEYYYDSSFTPDNVDFRKVTEVNYAFGWSDKNGDVYFTDQFTFEGLGAKSFSGGAGTGPTKCSPAFWHPFSNYDNTKRPAVCRGWNDANAGLVKEAHADGAKVNLSIGGWTLSHEVSQMLESPTARARFNDQIANLLRDWNFDGVDLDWEFPGYAPHGGRPIDKANFTKLLQELRAKLAVLKASTGKSYQLSAAVSCNPSIAANGYEFANIEPLLDVVNLMSYDFGGDWNSTAQHASPLQNYPGSESPAFNAAACTDFWRTTGTVPASKLVLGMAHYGRSVAGAKAIGQPAAGHDAAHWGGDTETRYYDIVAKQKSDPSFRTGYDATAMTAYGYFDNGGFISFENETSIAARTKYVLDQNLGGFMIWQLHGGMLKSGSGYTYPLLDAALAVLGGATPPSPTPTPTPTPTSASPTPTPTSASPTPTTSGACAAFKQPYAGDPSYKKGAKVTFNGQAYVSLMEPNWWSPSAAPTYWGSTTCGATTSPTPSPTPSPTTVSPTPTSTGSCAAFKQPYAGDPSYKKGSKVTFNGKAYVSLMEPNWWSPSAAPSYWAVTTC